MKHQLINNVIMIILSIVFGGKASFSQNESITDKLFSEIEYKLTNNDFDSLMFDKLLSEYPMDDYLNGIYVYYNLVHLGKDDGFTVFSDRLDCIEFDKKRTFIQMALGALELKRGNSKKAEDFYKKSLELDITKRNKWIRLELYYLYKDENFQNAITYLKEALEIDSEFSAAQMEMSNVLLSENNVSEALKLIENVIQRNNDPYAYIAKGNIYLNENRFNEAEELFKKAIEYEELFQAYIGLGDVNYAKQNYDEAEEFYSKAADVNLQSGLPYNRIGLIYIQKDELEQADTFFNKAINTEINANYYYDLIYIKVLKKEYKSAVKTLQYVVEYFGESRDVYFWDILLFSLKGDYDLGQAKIREFYAKYSDSDIEWLKNELESWGVEIN